MISYSIQKTTILLLSYEIIRIAAFLFGLLLVRIIRESTQQLIIMMYIARELQFREDIPRHRSNCCFNEGTNRHV
jgi:hypothetical protein